MNLINQSFKISKLLSKKLLGIISLKEKDIYNKQSSEFIVDDLKLLEIENEVKEIAWYENYKNVNIDEKWNTLKYKLKKEKRKKIKLQLFKYAAVIIPIITLANIFYFNNLYNTSNKTKIKPGNYKAILVKANGQKINLFNNKNIKKEINNNKIITHNNTIKYLPVNKKSVEYNKIIIPRGGEYTLTLSDGTKIWLNSETSITYPICFIDNKRIVQLKGEAYFEVKSDKTKPFIVKLNNSEIKVLGTKFNVESYNTTIKTTLVEGSVKVKNKINSTILKPNQQAILKVNNKIKVKNVIAKDYILWKDGIFYFEKATLNTIFKKLSRWYDVEVEFKNQALKNKLFSIEVKRYQNLNKILEILKSTEKIDYEITNKKLIIK